MMPNVLQYPVAIAAILRAGLTVVNVNPLYKPRELEFQLKDSGAEAIIVLENFASVLQEALPADRREACGGRQHGRHARHRERHAGQSGGAARQEDGAGLHAAGRDQVQRRAEPGPQAAVRPRFRRARRHRLPAIYRRHHRRRQGRDAPAPQSGRQCLADGCLERPDRLAAAADRPADHRHRAAALSHLRAHRLLPVRRAQRRALPADSQSARLRGADQGARQIQGELVSGGEHALQRAAASSRFRQARLEHAQDARSAAAWRCRSRSPRPG